MMKNPGRILVVDDSTEIRFLVSALLHSIGYETIEAATGTQALQALESDQQIRVVITDYNMPEMDGLELTRRIRRDERFEDLPVLMQSACALELLETRAESAGVTKLLPKPISPKTLQQEIGHILTSAGPDHVWRALLIGLASDTASTIRSTLSDAGFQVLQAHDEDQAREILQHIDGIDLAFEHLSDPDSGQFVRAHLLRTERDFNLFRLVMLMSGAERRDRTSSGSVCVAGYLLNPISPEKVSTLLRRLGLDSLHARH